MDLNQLINSYFSEYFHRSQRIKFDITILKTYMHASTTKQISQERTSAAKEKNPNRHLP